MKRSDYKQVILAFFVVLVLTSSYLFFLHMYKINNSNEFDSDDLEISFKTENIVELKDTLPLSDVVGKTIDVNDINDGIEGYLEFNIKNNSNQSTNYEIYIKRNQVNSEIDTSVIINEYERNCNANIINLLAKEGYKVNKLNINLSWDDMQKRLYSAGVSRERIKRIIR